MEELRHIREIEAVSRGDGASREPGVLDSWLRCLNQHGLDPAARSEAYIVPDSALRQHRQRSETLVQIARSGIESLYRLVAGQNYVLLLADRHGVTVEYLGDSAQRAELRRNGLFLGAEWREARAGTNALGACLETGEPIVIHQSDHFDATHAGLSCTAAPIFDTSGQLTAVLDLSALSSPRPRASQSLAFNLVRQAARRIEMANIMAESRREWVLRLSGSPDFLDVDPEAAISLDGAGRVIGMTNGAARLMARANGTDWRQGKALIGRPVSDFLDIRLDRLDDLTRQHAAADRLIETRDGHRLFAHAIEPRPSGGAVRAGGILATRLPATAPGLVTSATTALPAALRDLAGPDETAMTALLARAAALAKGRLPILIEGETGTGKAVLARALHAAGRGGALIVIPCAELGEADEALLFGHAGGNGRREAPGMIAAGLAGAGAARRGTLVLDKVAELPLRLQLRLLRLVEEGNWLPVGASRAETADLRIIATSQADLSGLIASGRLRPDLGHRLGGAVLRLPPLHRRADLPWLTERIFARAGAAPLNADLSQLLNTHGWPGNLRELDHLAQALAAQFGRHPPSRAELAAALGPLPVPPLPRDEVAQLRDMLRETRGNISEAARRLGLDRTTVHRRIRRFGL